MTKSTSKYNLLERMTPFQSRYESGEENQYDIGRRGGAENACVKVICFDGFVLLAQL